MNKWGFDDDERALHSGMGPPTNPSTNSMRVSLPLVESWTTHALGRAHRRGQCRSYIGQVRFLVEAESVFNRVAHQTIRIDSQYIRHYKCPVYS